MILRAGAALLLAASCAGGGGAAGSGGGGGSVSSVGTQQGGARMVQVIDDLVTLLSSDDLTMEQVVRAVGPVKEDDLAVGNLLVLSPVDRRFAGAKLFREEETGAPYLLELAPADPITVGELSAHFGAYERATVTHPDAPQDVLFYTDRGKGFTVAIIASVDPGARDLDAARVRTVSLRRDERLDD